MYLGIDLGTSAVKAILVDDAQGVVGEASVPLEISRFGLAGMGCDVARSRGVSSLVAKPDGRNGRV